ncbi:DUF2147 domain-containing protein [Sphingomonas sp. LT1P40]|uniref:DUF2147 domain-containing protein n=1 Tax=Alteristakelama amylovorans TaxID=3096166 RepID=UPI002FC9D2DD
MLSLSMMAPAIALALVAPQGGASAVGVWKAPTNEAVIEIKRCGASLCGRVVTSAQLRRNPDLKDARNANAALRGRPIKGLLMMSGFMADGAVWSGGTIYNAEDGKTYQARLTPVGPDVLKVRGCVFVPLCKTQIWRRVR